MLWAMMCTRFAPERVLDVCAGTNVIGIDLLKREPSLEVHAMDRSAAMQEVGGANARARGLNIRSYIGDVQSIVTDLRDLVVEGKRATERLGLELLERRALHYWQIRPEVQTAAERPVVR